MRACRLKQRGFEGSARRAGLAETGGDHDGGGNPASSARFDHAGNGGRGRGDDGEIHRLREQLDRREARDAANLAVPRIHREKGTLESTADEVFEQAAAHLSWIFRGADQRDGARLEQRREVMGAHPCHSVMRSCRAPRAWGNPRDGRLRAMGIG
jgi:hypothetical protein